jgi:hypothetical protein
VVSLNKAMKLKKNKEKNRKKKEHRECNSRETVKFLFLD